MGGGREEGWIDFTLPCADDDDDGGEGNPQKHCTEETVSLSFKDFFFFLLHCSWLCMKVFFRPRNSLGIPEQSSAIS